MTSIMSIQKELELEETQKLKDELETVRRDNDDIELTPEQEELLLRIFLYAIMC